MLKETDKKKECCKNLARQTNPTNLYMKEKWQ